MRKLNVYGYVIRGTQYDIPFAEMIMSCVPFADGIHIVTDQRFNDGTLEKLRSMEQVIPSLHIHSVSLDWENPAIDGATKQLAKEYCDAPVLMQMDADEVVREEDVPKIQHLKENWPTNHTVIATGVINWFNGHNIKLSAAGSLKERFHLNNLDIYHGIPTHLRVPIHGTDYYYAQPESTDGAGLIDGSGNPIAYDLIFANGDDPRKDFNNDDSIWIHHCSWVSLPRKWEMKQTWHWMWGRLFGRYDNLDEYTKDLDGEPVNFWGRSHIKPNESYIQPIKDEMKDNSIVSATSIPIPIVMQPWWGRQRIYVSRPWPFSDKKINMSNEPYRFSKT